MFIITNTYGQDIILRTTLYSPFDNIIVLKDQTVRLDIPVSSMNNVDIRALERGTGKEVKINEQVVFVMAPQDKDGKPIVLNVPEYICKYLCINLYICKFSWIFRKKEMILTLYIECFSGYQILLLDKVFHCCYDNGDVSKWVKIKVSIERKLSLSYLKELLK